MTLHILKMAVGCPDVEILERYQRDRAAQRREIGETPEIFHLTRNFPRRAAEIVDGGSLYWIVKGAIRVRQPIVEIDRVTKDDLSHCRLHLAAPLIRTEPRRCRPMQGWRYLEDADAPRDLPSGADREGDALPDEIIEELQAIGAW